MVFWVYNTMCIKIRVMIKTSNSKKNFKKNFVAKGLIFILDKN